MNVFKLDPAPTFDAEVAIPVHGGKEVNVKFTFKHRNREQLDEFFKDVVGKTDVETVKDVATGWGLSDEFSDENIGKLCSNYLGAGFAIAQAYLSEIRQARLGN